MKQILLFVFILLLVGETLQFILEKIYYKGIFMIDFKSISYIFFEVVVLAPVIETILIQFLLFEFLSLLFFSLSRKHLYSVLISGVLHQYNTAYMIALTILGLGFGFIYSLKQIIK